MFWLAPNPQPLVIRSECETKKVYIDHNEEDYYEEPL